MAFVESMLTHLDATCVSRGTECDSTAGFVDDGLKDQTTSATRVAIDRPHQKHSRWRKHSMSGTISTLGLFGAFLRPSIARSILVTTVLCGAGANLLGEDFSKRSCTPLPSGAVSWWPGDGNTNDIVGSNHGQLVGGAKFAPGFVGEAFKFDGINGYFQSGASGLPESSADRTMEMWVKLDSILPPDVTTSDYFEDFFAGYGQPGYLGEFFELYSEYEPPYGNALAWSQWFDRLAGHATPS